MEKIRIETIPAELKKLPQWVVWKMHAFPGRELTKVPFQVTDVPAKAGEPDTWNTFEAVCERFNRGGYLGIGFEFHENDSFCGIDLDGCRDDATGLVDDWAKQIILDFDTYAEVSPSRTGVKLYIIGKSPMTSGKKKMLDLPERDGKKPAIEVYDCKRYFAVTGWRLKGPHEPQPRQVKLDLLCEKYWPAPSPYVPPQDFRSPEAVVDRARRYVSRMDPAVSGSDGHGTTFKVACVLVLGFGLPEETALALLAEYNQRCVPPWSDYELRHKIKSANQQGGERNYLRNTSQEKWNAIPLPKYQEPEKPAESKQSITLLQATQKYLDSIKNGQSPLVELGLPDLDYALSGGVEFGEMVVFAARPSHGKSMAAMQCVQAWTADNCPVLVISEEMSHLALGKRSLLFLSDTPQERWTSSTAEVERDIADHYEQRADCYIVESCGTIEAVLAAIEKHVAEYKVRHVVVDYAQLLKATGKSRYEQITNVSIALRQITSRLNIVMIVLAQLNRVVEGRPSFTPTLADIKETGQFEQDADVIVFLVWPHRVNQKNPANEYQFFIAKNRNREIKTFAITCRIEPSRQRLTQQKPADRIKPEDRIQAFDNWNGDNDMSGERYR